MRQLKVLRSIGAAEQIALHYIRAKQLHRVHLLGCLYAFRHNAEFQCTGQVHDGTDNRQVDRVVRALHETLVDLQCVYRKIAQIAERALSGAKIVDRHGDIARP